MRLNKKKLAALAMSAVMAASTMPFPVLAEEFTDGTETTAVEQAEVAGTDAETTTSTATTEPQDADITWKCTKNDDGTYTAYAEWHNTKYDATNITKTADADCTSPETVKVEARIAGYPKSKEMPVGEALGHSYVGGKTIRVTTKWPTCTEEGTQAVFKVCDRDASETHYKKIEESDETIPKLPHKLSGDPVVTYSSLYNIKVDENNKPILKDGKPQIDNPTFDASYKKTVQQYCDTEKKMVTVSEETIPIHSDQTGTFVIDWKATIDNISSSELKKYDYYTGNIEDFDTSKIELEDCTKEGKFTFIAKDYDGDELYIVPMTVPAHHMEVENIEVTSPEDKALLTVTKENGKFVVKNNSCSKKVTYYVVKYCTAAKCKLEEKASDKKNKFVNCTTASIDNNWKVVSRTAVVAEPEGEHPIDNDAVTEINALVKNGSGVVAYADLEKIVKKYNDKYDKDDYITLSKDTATCTEKGKVTVTFLCHSCKTSVKTVDVVTKALGHDYIRTVDKSTIVKATCEKRGYQEIATLCTRCGKEKEGTTREIKYTNRLKHTNEYYVLTSGVGILTDNSGKYIDKDAEIKFIGDKVIDYNGENLKNFATGDKVYDASFIVGSSVSAAVYTNCTVCHNNEVKVKDVPSLTITGIKKEDASGVAGKITLKATYTTNAGKVVTKENTVPYYSSALAYAGRTEDEVINGLYQDKDLVTRYYVDGKVSEVSGIIKYAGKEYLVDKGVLCENTQGVTLVGDTFYFLANGCVQRGYTGVTIYDGQSFYLNNGVVDTDINGLVPYNGGTFLFAAGRLVKEHNGLWQDFDGSWYFLALGQVQTQYTGVAEYDGAYFYVKNGKLDTSKNGKITIDGVKYNAVNGQLYK